MVATAVDAFGRPGHPGQQPAGIVTRRGHLEHAAVRLRRRAAGARGRYLVAVPPRRRVLAYPREERSRQQGQHRQHHVRCGARRQLPGKAATRPPKRRSSASP
ncbi:hypothetical protein ACU686_14850 [Yinghuangia aomiensis]